MTNWHVLSGRNPRTGQPIHAQGAIPDRCSLALCALDEDRLVWYGFEVELGDALLGTATWLEHPDGGQEIDVAVLPLPGRSLGLVKDLLDATGHDSNMVVDVAAEVFLPGYPLGLAGGGLQPLWKRATVASSVELDPLSPSFYVDTATREGMSGAPCLAMSNWRHYSREPGSQTLTVVVNPMCWRLMGVYSGRREATDGLEAQIGIVWRDTTVFDTLTRGRPGSVMLRKP